jgi:hypothetical protein
MTNTISGINVIHKEIIDNRDFVEQPPMRISFTIIDELYRSNIIKDTDIITDLGAAAGDFLLYCKKYLKINNVKGINYYNNRHTINKAMLDKYNINIDYCEATLYNFKEDNATIYWIWIENPETELKIIEFIKNNVKNKSRIIIAYETMQYICQYCNHCKNIRNNISKKWKNYYYDISKLKDRIEIDNVYYKNIYFNVGDTCRQSGLITLVLIDL